VVYPGVTVGLLPQKEYFCNEHCVVCCKEDSVSFITKNFVGVFCKIERHLLLYIRKPA